MVAVAENLTFAEFQAQYSKLDRAYEFWYGRAIPKSMPTWIHGLLQLLIGELLREAGYIAGSEIELRIDRAAHPRPDLIATRSSVETPYPTKAVDVVAEILSPDDSMIYIVEKCQNYRAWGFPVHLRGRSRKPPDLPLDRSSARGYQLTGVSPRYPNLARTGSPSRFPQDASLIKNRCPLNASAAKYPLLTAPSIVAGQPVRVQSPARNRFGIAVLLRPVLASNPGALKTSRALLSPHAPAPALPAHIRKEIRQFLHRQRDDVRRGISVRLREALTTSCNGAALACCTSTESCGRADVACGRSVIDRSNQRWMPVIGEWVNARDPAVRSGAAHWPFKRYGQHICVRFNRPAHAAILNNRSSTGDLYANFTAS